MAMGRGLISLASAVICFAIAAPAVAQEMAGEANARSDGAPQEIRSDTTNRDLLDALIKRRAEVAGSGSGEGRHAALRFLDAQIADVTNQVLLDELLKRRVSAAQSNNPNNQHAIAFIDRQIAKVRSGLRN